MRWTFTSSYILRESCPYLQRERTTHNIRSLLCMSALRANLCRVSKSKSKTIVPASGGYLSSYVGKSLLHVCISNIKIANLSKCSESFSSPSLIWPLMIFCILYPRCNSFYWIRESLQTPGLCNQNYGYIISMFYVDL